MSKVGVFGQISQINDHLFLSGAGVLVPEKIKQKKITCIVNATIEEPNAYLSGIDYLKVRVDDNPNANLDSYFDIVADKIKSTKDRGGRTLVHCVAGVSRSASLCIVYLMKYQHMSLRQAYQYVKSSRPIIRPNIGFWKQMIDYEHRLSGRTSVTMVPAGGANPHEVLPDLYANELRRHAAFAQYGHMNGSRTYSRSNSIGRRSVLRRPPPPPQPSISRRSASPAYASSALANSRNYNSLPGSSLSTLAYGSPMKSRLKGTFFSSLYQSTQDILFPTF